MLSATFVLAFARCSRQALAVVVAVSCVAAHAAPAVPNPCSLVTAAEVGEIVGPLKSAPRPGDIAAGDVSCEFTPVKGPRYVSVRLHDGELAQWKKRNGGASPIALPELGKDAFANADFEGVADLYAKKGAYILRVSMPKSATAVEMDKAIARKALARM